MSLFLSTYINKIDKKGRVSMPIAFRNLIAKENDSSVILYKSFINNSIEGCSVSRIEKISDSIDELDPYSEKRDAFATAILGGCEQVKWDSDGRVVLSKQLIEESNIEEKVLFVGKGKHFEIWNPEIFNSYSKNVNEIARKNRGLLKLTNKSYDK